MVNIVVLISGGGTNLQALLDLSSSGGIPGGRIAAVVSSRKDAYGLQRAKQAGVPAYTLDRREFKTTADFSRALEALLAPMNPGLLVLAGFLPMLDEIFCLSFSNRIMNIHPSLIPAFCGKGHYGLKVHEAVLAYGVKVTGATVHFVTPDPDGGPIIAQQPVAVLPGDTPEILQRRVMEEAEWRILPQAVSLFCQNRLRINGRSVTILKPENEMRENG